MAKSVYIVDAVRTPVGRFGGGLSNCPAVHLGAKVISAIVARLGVPVGVVDEVIIGQVLTAGCGQNPARQASLRGGLPESCPAWSINRLCGSGLQSVGVGAMAIVGERHSFVLAGGMENMSAAPHLLPDGRKGHRLGHIRMLDSMIHDGLWDAHGDVHMAITAENLAAEAKVSRADQDQFAYESQQKCGKAMASGAFAAEITAVEVPAGKSTVTVAADEHPRPDTTLEALAGLRPAFKSDGSGTVTAGNASGINDGAAMVALASEGFVAEHGLKPLARVVDWAVAGVAPQVMGIGPVPAIQQLLQRNGLTVADIDLFELNEAFAAQSLAVIRALGLPTDRVNVNGGAIALGHPIGASGARVLTTLVHAMRARGAKRGIAALCIGGGEGIAMLVSEP